MGQHKCASANPRHTRQDRVRTQQPTHLLRSYYNHRHRVVGATGSGKTTVSRIRLVIMVRNSPGCIQFINLASGSNLRVGMTFEPCTTDVSLADEFILDGKAVTLIDTPGFNDAAKSDADTLKIIAAFLATT